jgi:hypothetical protein
MDLEAILAELQSEAACPSEASTHVRAEAGTSCATYEAEVSVWVARCVGECDEEDLTRWAVRLAAARCSTWCTEKSCGTASFIPPPDGCRERNCFHDPLTCPDAQCPLREYCSLIDTERVWNCFCRDLIPS